ncbi:hypothetical protein LS684_09695 [Cytobacillus spongiae]|uniref:hypothetical protein n=1 Tax=Cytobacillus spongiae TaxID=2901381 RepID=UPI001F2D50AA|nr:hypothetical protein [Cytobacillus spongiae]UII57667.1 hypothetical protein LS684_09695 [Cytobacillus spongiae]
MMVILNMLISLSLFCNLGMIQANNQMTVPPPKVMKSAYTNIPETNNWVIIPKGVDEITIYVEAENAETVLFWLIPTGTQTWWERSLIGYAINTEKEAIFKSPQTFSITWKIDKPFLHDHIEVQLIGMNESTSGGSINITMDRDK